jgi:hypothetical protein
MSGFIARALAEQERRESLGELLRDLIAQHGEPAAKDIKWAERALAPPGIVLDAGAPIALDRGDKRMIALLQRALAQDRTFRVPAGVVGQAWRNGRVQATLARFLRTDEVERSDEWKNQRSRYLPRRSRNPSQGWRRRATEKLNRIDHG